MATDETATKAPETPICEREGCYDHIPLERWLNSGKRARTCSDYCHNRKWRDGKPRIHRARREQLLLELDAREFDGETYDVARDGFRLSSQLNRVRMVMWDGEWRTLRQIQAACGGSEASISARLRDLRKTRFGAHTVSKRVVEGTTGLWEYRLEKH